jgi:hypothetical protein
MGGPDEGAVVLRKLASDEWPKLSEADTRSKMIDPLLIECLGWEEKDLTREEHVTEGFVDYTIGSNGVNFLIIEAKKNGVGFELPKEISERRYKINGVIKSEKDLVKCIEQAQRYCVEKGIRHGIVTNGNQYVIFEAFRYNSSWREGKCLVYHSLDDMLDNFVQVWNLLSKDAVLNGSLKAFFTDQPELLTYTRPLDKIHNKDATLYRNSLYPYLQPFAEYFFSELIDESKTELLRDCYIHQKAQTDAEDILRPYFLERIKYLRKFDVNPFVETEKDAGRFGDSFERAETLLHDTPQGKLVLLLGGVGSGKTTFLHRFFKVVLEDREKLVWLYVDCRNAPVEPDKIESFVLKEMLDDFRDKYESNLSQMLSEAGVGELRPVQRDIVLLFAVLRVNGYSVTLVLDNVDQQGYLSPALQEQIFLEAQHLSKTLKAVEVLSMREETFFRSKTRGVLDAYYVERYGIHPPRFDRLIERRLDAAVALLRSSDDRIQGVLKMPPPQESQRKELTGFFNILKGSLGPAGPSHRGISNFITSISKGNMRLALEFFHNFLSSGNTKVEEMLTIYHDTEGYTIPYHAFLKSVILGDRRYYSSNSSHVMNLFDMNTDLMPSHFLLLHILQYTYDRMQIDTAAGRGMIDINVLKIESEKVGVKVQAIDDSLAKLFKFGLIEFESGAKDPAMAKYFTLTPTGDYYLNVLVRRFPYLDLVWQDTPVSDSGLVDVLRKIIDEKNTDIRLERVEQFLDYLAKEEEREFTNNPEYQESALMGTRFMKVIMESFKDEKEYIGKKQEARSYGSEPETFSGTSGWLEQAS